MQKPHTRYEVSILMFFQKEVKLLWARHSFKFTAPERGKSSPRPPPATAPSSLHLTFLHPAPSWSRFGALHIDCCVSVTEDRSYLCRR